jgi:hypothetical protein
MSEIAGHFHSVARPIYVLYVKDIEYRRPITQARTEKIARICRVKCSSWFCQDSDQNGCTGEIARKTHRDSSVQMKINRDNPPN